MYRLEANTLKKIHCVKDQAFTNGAIMHLRDNNRFHCGAYGHQFFIVAVVPMPNECFQILCCIMPLRTILLAMEYI